jgi:transcription elongation factor GreA
MTAAARQALERELATLRLEKQHDIPRRLRLARDFGDMANNEEHQAIREDEAVLAARIARLEDILMRATVVEGADADDSASIGSRVSVVDLISGESLEYVIDGAHGLCGPGIVSVLSPVGRALLGRRRGERVTVELPSGRRRELELRAVRADDHAAQRQRDRGATHNREVSQALDAECLWSCAYSGPADALPLHLRDAPPARGAVRY